MSAQRLSLAASLVALMVVAAPAHAQTCDGYPSLRSRPYRAELSTEERTYAAQYRLTLTGGRRLFGSAMVGTMRDEELDARTLDLGASLGFDVAPPSPVAICPRAHYTLSIGPREYLLQPMDLRYSEYGGGIAAGALVIEHGWVAVRPTATVWLNRLTVKQIFRGLERGSFGATDEYVITTVAVGVELGQRVVVRPHATIPTGLAPQSGVRWLATPFGREAGEVAWGIGVALLFGGR